YGILKQHKGFIEVTSAPGVGSKFSVFVPVTSKTAEAPPPGRVTRMAPRNDLTILIVDDEEDLLSFCQVALSEICSNILTARDGVEALEIVERNRDAIDLVLLDVTMPRMDGYECYRRLRELQPDLDVILTSGYSLEDGEGLVQTE